MVCTAFNPDDWRALELRFDDSELAYRQYLAECDALGPDDEPPSEAIVWNAMHKVASEIAFFPCVNSQILGDKQRMSGVLNSLSAYGGDCRLERLAALINASIGENASGDRLPLKPDRQGRRTQEWEPARRFWAVWLSPDASQTGQMQIQRAHRAMLFSEPQDSSQLAEKVRVACEVGGAKLAALATTERTEAQAAIRDRVLQSRQATVDDLLKAIRGYRFGEANAPATGKLDGSVPSILMLLDATIDDWHARLAFDLAEMSSRKT